MSVIEQLPPPSGARPAPPLSQRLTDPLQVVVGRARFLAFLKAMAQLLALVAGVWLAMVLLLGWRFRWPLWVGLPFAALGWAAVLYGAYRILRPLFRKERTLTSAALLVDRALPDTEERISSAVEISQEPNPDFRGSPELVACLMRQAEHHAETLDPGHVISGKQVGRWLSSAAVMLLLWLVMFILLTPNMLLGLQRMLQPWTVAAELPAPTLDVTAEVGVGAIQPTPDAEMAQGDKLTIRVGVKPPEGVTLDNGHGDIDTPILTQKFSGMGGLFAPDVTSKMERTGPREFRLIFDHVRQSFTYHINVQGNTSLGLGPAASNDYAVTVHTKPAVADVEVQYTYPAYTGLPQRTEHSREGTIDAVIGTVAHVVIHTTEPVKKASLKLVDDGFGSHAEVDLAAVAGAAAGNGGAGGGGGGGQAAYAGDVTVSKSTQYQVYLVKADGQENAEETARIITARPDNPPSIAITTPDPKAAALKVNPTDTVVLKYVATDDYGVSKVEALIDVDGLAMGTFDVPPGVNGMGSGGDTRISGEWELKLPEILKTAPGTAKQVGFRFKATDSHVPLAQTALTSPRQYLDLDKSAAPLAQRQETGATKDLKEGVRQAIENLKAAQEGLDTVKKNDIGKALSPGDAEKLAAAQKKLAEAREKLSQAADQAAGSRMGELAKQAKEISEGEVRKASDDAVSAGLASDQPAARRDSEAAAEKNAQQAIEKLNQVSQALGDAEHRQPLAQALERLAEQQKQLADALAKNPNAPALLDQQKKLQEDLEKLIKENPELQKPVADANKGRLNDLANKVHDLENAQKPLSDQMQSTKDGMSAADQARDLAKRQQELNDDIQKFARDNDATMKQNGAPKPPDAGKLDPIVKELEGNKLDNAARDQRAAASALEQTQHRLDAAQKQLDSNPTSKAKAQQAASDAAAAADAKKQAEDLRQKIDQAKSDHNPPTRASDPANQDAVKLADQIKKQAQQMKGNADPKNNAEKLALQAAEKSADTGKAAAAGGNADKAQQELQNAAAQLAAAAQAEKGAAGTTPDQTPPGDAARTAGDLAQRQRELADNAGTLAKAQDDAAKAQDNAAGMASKQQQLADKMNQAANDARQLAKETQGPAPDLSQKASAAAKSLDDAAQSQRDAAQSVSGNDVPQAAARQQKSADQLADADQALTGQRPQTGSAGGKGGQAGSQARGNPGGSPPQSPPSGGRSGGSESAGGQSASGQSGSPSGTGASGAPSASGSPSSAGSPGGQSASGSSAGTGASGAPSGSGSPSGAGSSGGQSANGSPAGAGSPGGSSGNGSPSGAGAGSASGQSASGTPSGGSGGQAGGSSGGSDSAGGAGAGGGQSASGVGASGQGRGSAGAGAPSGGGAGSPGQSGGAGGVGSAAAEQAAQAAQAVQGARSAQGQAAGGDSAAARRAAEQLAQAAQQMKNGSGQSGASGSGQSGAGQSGAGAGSSGQTTSGGGSGPGSSRGSGTGSASAGGGGTGGGGRGAAGGSPGSARGSGGTEGGGGGGIQMTDGGRQGDVPKEVQEAGVAPSDWARLSPQMQDQLLHAAQQPGPPGYRDMIKDYYSKIARMQAPAAGTGGAQ